jgi:hypothetical protein
MNRAFWLIFAAFLGGVVGGFVATALIIGSPVVDAIARPPEAAHPILPGSPCHGPARIPSPGPSREERIEELKNMVIFSS